MECCQGSSLLSLSLCCFPKASAKVQLFFYLPNFFKLFFKKNAHFFFFQLLRILASPCNFFYQASVSFRYLVDNSNNIIGLYSLYNRKKGSLATTRVGVEYYGIKLAVAHRCFVYALTRTHVLGEKQPFVSMLFCVPRFVIAQMMLIRTLYLITVYMAERLKRTGRLGICLQVALLKKPQTQGSSGCLYMWYHSCW